MTEENYYVVFEYNEKAGGFNKCRYIICYKNEEDFLNAQKESWDNREAIAKGITSKEAEDLCKQVPEENLILSAIQESLGPDGKVNESHLEMHLRNIAFLKALDNMP